MPDSDWLERQTQISLERLLPRLEARLSAQTDSEDWQVFVRRLRAHFGKLFRLLLHLYGQQYDFFFHLENILATAARMWLARPNELRALDAAREADPLWFQSNQMLGGVCYVDLFAADSSTPLHPRRAPREAGAGTWAGLNGIRAKIPYFKELGLTYLHLMPLFKVPQGENDGGYAVSSYREVNPALGTMQQLAELASELRHNGISLVLDFVFNHTSDEHAWAMRARAGDAEYQGYYWMFPDRAMPDACEKNLREIFPDEHPGAFTPLPNPVWRGTNGPPPPQERGLGGEAWVWTTFHSFQWDLNYSNPAVFNAMAEEMLFLANIGVEVLRLDAVAFIWKQRGTNCENLPEAHMLIQAFNALARIAAPALVFKSEAIVHPDEVVKYIGADECPLSYNPLLMALLWNSLATRKTRLLSQAMRDRFKIDPKCAWVNYVRCHDDIGWTFSDEDAAVLGVKGYDHRQFLNQFYTGRFAGSFAHGVPFQENPKTGDCRISGTGASLAGLERALQAENATEVERAIRRILLLHGIILSIGGIPLIYLGDEIGTLNDYGYRADPAKAADSRWVHRPRMNWGKAARRTEPDTIEGKIYTRLRHLIDLRQRHVAFAVGAMDVIDLDNVHAFGYVRQGGGERIVALTNFSEREQTIAAQRLRPYAWSRAFADLVSGERFALENDVVLEPYRFVWLAPTAE